jgi:hypothetical protein
LVRARCFASAAGVLEGPSSVGNMLERGTFVLCVRLHGVDQIRNQAGAPTQLQVDAGPRFANAVAGSH